MIISKPIIYIISDLLGETAEFVARAATSQYNGSGVEFRRIPYVSGEEHLLEVLEEASHYNSLIAYTLVVEELKKTLEKEAEKRSIPTVDVLGPMLKGVRHLTGFEPRREPGLLHKLDDDYFRKIEAIEFAVKYDDGKDPKGVIYADIVLLGVSRTSKTPLCMYLAHKRIKAANIPLVPEVNPPEELFGLPRNKVVGLTIRPQILNEIRQERLKALGLVANADYASMERILKELEYAENIMKRIGCSIIDVSNKAIEETASRILQIYYRGDMSVK
ncbi:MAG: pyruvate, water dikinase regulatory protein [Peptococcales bacterium]|jgi:regulator of PEP synthase PpsR (kinase-PPPase family)